MPALFTSTSTCPNASRAARQIASPPATLDTLS
jgi:hypothetical protein